MGQPEELEVLERPEETEGQEEPEGKDRRSLKSAGEMQGGDNEEEGMSLK